MAEQKPLIRDSSTGQVRELTAADNLNVGAGIAPTFLDYPSLLATATFAPNGVTAGFIPGV